MTERHDDPAQLRRQLHEQSQMIDHAREGIVVLTLEQVVSYWSVGAQRVFGHSPRDALGRSVTELLGAGAGIDASAMQALKDATRTDLVEAIDASGRAVTVERTCALLRDEAGLPSAVLMMCTDITERLRAEKEIVLLNNMLEQRIRKRTAELEESNEDLRDFAYSLAHDLRAPLASIDGFSAQLELRLADRLDERSRHYLARVRAGVRLMSDLTDALLALADLSNAELLQQTVDLSALARTIAARLRERDPQRDVQIRIEDTPRARGDIRLLSSVLENLIGNAWKFTAKTPSAVIEFGGQRWPNGSYLYHVRDNGPGFDPAYAYKLFGPFQRLHTSAEFEGTGIGLAIVRKIVSRHGGRVWAESLPGEGASFYFTLNEGTPEADDSG